MPAKGPADKMRAPAMHTPRSRPVSPQRLVWLLWVALLLPISQSSAAWHAVSHSATEASARHDPKASLHPSHCDLCLIAAAVTGGALASAAPSMQLSAARHRAPQGRFASVWLAPPTRVYRSRAPPFSAH